MCGMTSSAPLCDLCYADVSSNANCCAACARPLARPAAVCGHCLVNPHAFESVVSACRYEYPLDAMLGSFKYRPDLTLLPALALLMQRVVPRLQQAHGLAVAVPMHAARQRSRGFNQAELLLRSVVPQTALRSRRNLLTKPVATRPQAGLGRDARRSNLASSLYVRSRVQGCDVWVFDDVMTTGATLDACARVLRRAGARAVHAVVLARVVS